MIINDDKIFHVKPNPVNELWKTEKKTYEKIPEKVITLTKQNKVCKSYSSKQTYCTIGAL